MRTRAAVVRAAGEPWTLTELELDEPREREVRVRLKASGLCHSDDHVRTGDFDVRYPMVGGHEGAGVVEAVGDHVSRVAVGDRIAFSYLPVCGTCRYCSTGHQNLCDAGLHAGTGQFLDGTFRFHEDGQDVGGFCTLGTFSEQVVVSEYSCVKIDEYLPFEVAALLSCGVPTGWGSSVHVAGVRAGDTVVVFGCGGVGVNAVQGASYAGARHVVVVDPVAFKREKALEFGATHTFERAEEAHDFVREVTYGQLADHAVVTVGLLTAQIVTDAAQIVGKGGQVTLTSMGRRGETQVQLAAAGMLLGYQRRVQGHVFGMSNPLFDIPRLIGLYRDGRLKLDELITRRYTLDEVNQGYEDMLRGRNIRGVIVHDG